MRGLTNFIDQHLSAFAVSNGDANLDQFMVIERAIQFGQHAVGGALLADNNYRFEVVANAFVGFLLFRAKRHNDLFNVLSGKSG